MKRPFRLEVYCEQGGCGCVATYSTFERASAAGIALDDKRSALTRCLYVDKDPGCQIEIKNRETGEEWFLADE